MLTSKTLNRLVLILFFCIFTFLALAYKSDKIVILQQNERFLPDLDPANVAKVTVASNECVLTFERHEKDWQIVQRQNYPALAAKVDDLIYNILDLTIVEPKTTNKEYYKLLGVDSVSDSSAHSILLTLQDKDEQTLARIIIGKRDGDNIFMRKAGDPQTWLVSGTLDLTTELQDWVFQPLIGILDEDQIQQISIQRAGSQVVIAKQRIDQPDFELQSFASPERDFLDRDAVNAAPYQIAEIMYDDVVPDNSVQLNWDKAVVVNLNTFGDKVLKFEVARAPEGIFARIDSRPGWYFRLSTIDYALLTMDNSDFVLADFK